MGIALSYSIYGSKSIHGEHGIHAYGIRRDYSGMEFDGHYRGSATLYVGRMDG